MSLLLVFGQTGKDNLKNTTKLTGLHHVHVEFVEHLGMLAQAFRECRTSLNRIGDIVDRCLENGIGFLLTQNVEPSKKRESGIDQGGQLTGKDHQNLWLNLAADLAAFTTLGLAFALLLAFFAGSRRNASLSLGNNLGRVETLSAKCLDRF